MKSIGEKIRKERKKQGLSQVELARRSMVSNSNLCRIEAGVQIPHHSTLSMIAKALGVNEDMSQRLSEKELRDIKYNLEFFRNELLIKNPESINTYGLACYFAKKLTQAIGLPFIDPLSRKGYTRL